MTKKENQRWGIWIMAGEVVAFAVVLAVVITLMGCSQSDADTVSVQKTFTWTAPADNGASGMAAIYDFRWSSSEAGLQIDWNLQPSLEIHSLIHKLHFGITCNGICLRRGS